MRPIINLHQKLTQERKIAKTREIYIQEQQRVNEINSRLEILRKNSNVYGGRIIHEPTTTTTTILEESNQWLDSQNWNDDQNWTE